MLISQWLEIDCSIKLELGVAVLVFIRTATHDQMLRSIVLLKLIDSLHTFFLARRFQFIQAIKKRQQAALVEPAFTNFLADSVFQFQLERLKKRLRQRADPTLGVKS